MLTARALSKNTSIVWLRSSILITKICKFFTYLIKKEVRKCGFRTDTVAEAEAAEGAKQALLLFGVWTVSKL